MWLLRVLLMEAVAYLSHGFDEEPARPACRVDDLVLHLNVERHDAGSDHALGRQELTLARLQGTSSQHLKGC